IPPELLVACLREELAGLDDDVIVLSEAISNYQVVNEHLRCATPGALIGSGGGSLGWYAGASIGVKLARPDALVVSLVGDGTYLFGVPASAQWVSRRYDAPSLTVIFDNQAGSRRNCPRWECTPTGSPRPTTTSTSASRRRRTCRVSPRQPGERGRTPSRSRSSYPPRWRRR
ncbi:MAG: thiamine pyrophosphate-dependent enzyme, partial [Pseudonocardiaceae bacterium]